MWRSRLPGYLVLPPLVVDCSVMVAAMFEEAARDQAIALMSGKLLFRADPARP